MDLRLMSKSPRAIFYPHDKIKPVRQSAKLLEAWLYIGSLALCVVVLAPGCGSEQRRARFGSHPLHAEPHVVDSPPPPAEIESLARDPGAPCVWVDGRWRFERSRWEWEAGGWVEPPADCYYAPSTLVWLAPPSADTASQSELYYTPGKWYTDSGEDCSPRVCALAP